MSKTPPLIGQSRMQRQNLTWLIRIAMVLVVAGSATLVWWITSKRLVPASHQLQNKALEMARLANEVQQLEMNWNAAEVARTEIRFAEAQAQLFNNDEAVIDWRQEAERRAEAFGLEPSSGPAQSQSQLIAGQKLRRVAVSLGVRPLNFARTTNEPYRRLLQFSRILENSPKRIDVVDVSISGNSNSVREARLLLEAWTREPEAGTAKEQGRLTP